MRNFVLILSVFFITIGFQAVSAQQVNIQNRIEYSQEESGIEDVNSITIPAKKIKKTKKEDGISIDELQRVVKKRRATRYRKVRKETEKCFKDTVEEKSCDDKDLEKKLPKRKKQ